MCCIEFKICVVAGNGSRDVVTHQIFLYIYIKFSLFSKEILEVKEYIFCF